MFDFFRDIIQEAGGIDTAKAKKQREEQREIEKLSRYIFSAKLKRFMLIIGISYLFFSVLMIATVWNVPSNIYVIAKYVVLAIIDIIVCVALLKGAKKGEIVALIGGLIFILLLYASIFIR